MFLLKPLKKQKQKSSTGLQLDGIIVKVRGPEGDINGIGEHGIATELDKIVQFERFGFCRIDAVDEEKVVAYFAHK